MSETAPPRNLGPFELHPIGTVRSPYRRRHGTPQQASAVGSEEQATIELDPRRVPPEALADLVGIDRIWVVSWLDRGGTYSPTVIPPRGPAVRRGLFSTRSPDRPNPIGLSCVRLERVEGTVLHVRGVDLLDGTPVLDIKPYLPYADSFPSSRAGWIDEIPVDARQRIRSAAEES